LRMSKHSSNNTTIGAVYIRRWGIGRPKSSKKKSNSETLEPVP
jgi:hypothetical protein